MRYHYIYRFSESVPVNARISGEDLSDRVFRQVVSDLVTGFLKRRSARRRRRKELIFNQADD